MHGEEIQGQVRYVASIAQLPCRSCVPPNEERHVSPQAESDMCVPRSLGIWFNVELSPAAEPVRVSRFLPTKRTKRDKRRSRKRTQFTASSLRVQQEKAQVGGAYPTLSIPIQFPNHHFVHIIPLRKHLISSHHTLPSAPFLKHL